MYNWSTLKKLIWLYATKLKGGASDIIETITGNLPLVLQNAIQHTIKSFTRYGLCTQDGTPTPSAPVDIMCNNGALKWDSVNQCVYADGTPEVLTVNGANLLNPATNITGKYIKANGSIATGSDSQYTDLIPVKEGATYVCSLVSGRGSGTNRWHGYDANGGWVKQLAEVSASGKQGAKLTMAATIDPGISYVRLSYAINDTDAMISPVTSKNWEGYYPIQNYASNKSGIDTSTVIQSPYTTPAANRGIAVLCEVEQGKIYAVERTVTADKSFVVRATFYSSKDDVTNSGNAIGFKGLDAQVSSFEPVSGAAYAVIAFSAGQSGTVFTFDSNSIKLFYADADYQPYVPPQTASVPMLLSVGDVKDEVELIHGPLTRRVTACLYDGTQDVGDIYLSTTGGKDIGAIIVYPLATPTTEHITGQNLATNEGTNIVDSVANVNPLGAEVKYMTASAQDVLSTLLGMRVTPKDISTQDAEDMIDIITGEDNK